MAFVHGKSGKVMINAGHLSADIRQWSAMFKRNYADVTALQDDGVKNILGIHEGTVSMQGHFDSTAGRLVAVITDFANAGAANLVNTDNGMNSTILPEGDTIGNVAIFAAMDLEEFEVEAEVDDAVKVSFEGTADNMVDMGASHKALGAQSPGTTNQTSVDNGAATTNGGAAMLHVTNVSGGGNLVAKVQHSTDNSVWADLITFTTFTAAGSERKELAAGITVNRYTRITGTATTGTYTYQGSFARR